MAKAKLFLLYTNPPESKFSLLFVVVQVITGFQRYADTVGSRFAGAHKDQMPAPMLPNQQRLTKMVAIDAKPFNRDKLEQYKEINICRELNKAFVGFINE